MLSNRRKYIFYLAGSLLTALTLVAACAAASTAQTVTAYQGVRIEYKGSELTDSDQPLMINNVTYIPLRMLTNNFDQKIAWDSANYQVIITESLKDDAVQEAQINSLKSTIITLNGRMSALKAQLSQKANISTVDIKTDLSDYFKNVGKDFFADEEVTLASIKISGNKNNLAYTLKLDFKGADKYDDIRDVNQSNLENFLDEVQEQIEHLIISSDFAGATIKGNLYDKHHDGYYVKFNGKSYSYSWLDEVDLNNMETSLANYFKNAGHNYLGDDEIVIKSVNLSEDDNNLLYTIKLDFSNADYDDLTDISTAGIKNFMNDFQSKLNSKIDNTDYEDGDISGDLIDNAHPSYYVRYKNGSYTFSWQ